MSRPHGKTGRQHIALLTEIRYLAELHKNECLTVRQMNDILGGTIAGTRGILLRMLDDGLICGKQLKSKQWEFYTCTESN